MQSEERNPQAGCVRWLMVLCKEMALKFCSGAYKTGARTLVPHRGYIIYSNYNNPRMPLLRDRIIRPRGDSSKKWRLPKPVDVAGEQFEQAFSGL